MKLNSYSSLPLLCSIIFVFITTNLTAQDYYPLEIGNRWDYKTHYWDFGGGGGDSSFHSVEVIGDSLLQNNKQYFVLSRGDLIGGEFVRVDENHIYYYNTYQNREDTIINLDAELNVTYFPESEYAWSVELVEIDTIILFDKNTRKLRYRVEGLILRYINLSDKFGLYHLDSPGEPPGTTQWSTNVYYGIIGGEEFGNPVSVDETESAFPTMYSLSQNYQNPFNPTTTISYSVPEKEFVSLKVYDVLGNEIATLVNEEKPAGEYNVEFRIDNLEVSSGIYFFQLRAGEFIQTKKMVLIK
jgi:hypothetical protein